MDHTDVDIECGAADKPTKMCIHSLYVTGFAKTDRIVTTEIQFNT